MNQEAEDVITALRDEDECNVCHRIVLIADMLEGACPECYKAYSEQLQMEWEQQQWDMEEDERRARRELEHEEGRKRIDRW